MNLGKYEINNIYNEDCYEGIKKIPDKSIDLVYIDIPYEKTKTNGYYSGGGSFGVDNREYQKNLRDNNLMDGIDYSIFNDICRIMKKIYIYIWCSKEQLLPIMKYFIDEKNCFMELLFWGKTNPTPTCNCKYLSDVEYCLMFREKGTLIYGNYETKSKFYISQTNKDDKENYVHDTIKPLDFVKNHIVNSTKEGDLVLDCFMGSGTTAVACKELNRNFIGFELNPKYWQIAVDRVNGITQKDKRIKESGIMDIFDFLGGDDNGTI